MLTAQASKSVESAKLGAPLTIFLHLHKCGGTTVVKAARQSGFSFAANNFNGNLKKADGKALKYRHMGKEKLRETLCEQVAAGVNFIAMEWDFPIFDNFPTDIPIRYFTVLRNPVTRAISNLREAKVEGRCPGDVALNGFIDASALHRSNNYYVRMLCGLRPDVTVEAKHLVHAESVLRRFDAVIVLEKGNLHVELQRLGFNAAKKSRANTLESKHKHFGRFGRDALQTTLPEVAAFCLNNAPDMALYTVFAETRDFDMGRLGTLTQD